MTPKTDKKKWYFLPHPDAERFDAVTVETLPRWKESELSGDEWRFSYRARFYSHGIEVAAIRGGSVEDCLLQAAAQFSRVKPHEDAPKKLLEEVCCQPGCEEAWTVLMHPHTRCSSDGSILRDPYPDHYVRGFCARHRHRGDCAIDDADPNYTVVEERSNA